MILESIGISIAISSLLFASVRKSNPDESKIMHTFNNVGYKVENHLPSLLKVIEKQSFNEYVYNVPYGLVDDPKLQPILQKTIDKPVHVYFDGKLHIRVHEKDVPKKIDYVWKQTDGWTTPIGHTHDDLILHDFDKIPHMTIAGMTRQGKTVLLKLIMAHLSINHPNDAEFYIIDLKGGLEFGPYENLKQVKKVASNVLEAEKVLEDLHKQIKHDMQYFKQKGYSNVLDTPITKRKFIIVDEGAELVPGSHLNKDEKKPYKHCQHVLSEISRVAGALGYRNIFCTQYPTADTLPRQIKQNSDAKISFRLPTEIASRVAIDESGAEQINNVGKAIYRTHEKHTLQVPYISDKDIKEYLKEWEDVSAAIETTDEGRTDIVTFG